MRCPFCGTDNDKVIDSRASDEGKAIRRRRCCLNCNKRFTTYEHIEERTRLTVIKRDGSRVPFDKKKIFDGVDKACYKRAVSDEAIQQLVDEVEEEIFRNHEREVRSLEIGNTIASKLKKLDQVAYVRFASVYKQFRDIEDLLEEVREVMRSGHEPPPEQGKLF
jgi:transcriptional repressor NrdR